MTTMKRKTIHFFRHAEATHNVPFMDENFSAERDTPLTPRGIWQAKNILTTSCAANFKNPTLIISSPSRRTLQTTLYAFHSTYNPDLQSSVLTGTEFPNCKLSVRRLQKLFHSGKIKFLADPRITEVCACYDEFQVNKPLGMEDQLSSFLDTFTFPPELFPSGREQDWVMRKGFYNDQIGSLMVEERCKSFTKFILERPEKEIIIVSHQGFLVNYLLDPFEIPEIANANGVTVDFIWKKGFENPEGRLRMREKKVKVQFIQDKLSIMVKTLMKISKKERLSGINAK